MNNAQPRLAADAETVVEVTYVPIKKLGKGAFGEAVLYRKVEVTRTPVKNWCHCQCQTKINQFLSSSSTDKAKSYSCFIYLGFVSRLLK